MSNALVIVESPGKVKTISKILGSGYTVRPTVGHIIDLAKGRGGGDIGIDIQNGFKPRYEVLSDKKDKIKAIIDAAKTADEIFVASDDDREGEAIAFHIVSQIEHLGKPLKRITFKEITDEALNYAIKNPKEFNQDLFDAQQARRVLDRIVGFMVSPYLSKKLGDKLSAGRVQSVALRMIVDREREIEAFVPEVFYNISVDLKKNGQEFNAKLCKNGRPYRVPTEDEAKQLRDKLADSIFHATKPVAQKSFRNPLPPLTTSKLQQEGSTKLKFNADRTMKAAQGLYEAGHVTYIRTDSTASSKESIAAVREYITANGMDVPKSHNTFKNKDSAQEAHEAIRPTKITAHPDKIALEGDQLKVYNLIWRMFVASQMCPAEFHTVKVEIEGSKIIRDDKGNVSEYFVLAEGKILKKEGWMEIAQPFLKKEKDVMLPDIVDGDKLELKPPVKMDKSQTKPSPRYTVASLINELEAKGIGRPSTFASIISRITNRKYVKSTAKGFFPTDLGKSVTDDLKDSFTFMDYMYTADMEKKLDEVAEGKLDYVSMMSGFFDSFKEEFQKARGSQGLHTGIECPKCGADTVVRKSKYGFFGGCVKYPDCKGIVSISVEDGKVFKKEQTEKIKEDVTCPTCGAGMVPRPDGKFGPFYSCSKYPKCKGSRKMPFGKKCPECGDELFATLMKEEMKLGCMSYPKCKHVEDIPEGANVNWLDPNEVTPPKYSNKVEKVLK